MDILGIAAYALQALDLVPKFLAAGQDISGFLTNTKNVIQTANDTQTKIPASAWDEQKAVREGLQGRLHSA